MLEFLISQGHPKEEVPCKGCKTVKGKCPAFKTVCETYRCVQDRKLTSCASCSDFPCDKLQPCSNMANMLPHNMKVHNLATIK